MTTTTHPAAGGTRRWRWWLIAGLVTALLITLGVAGAVVAAWTGATTDTVGTVEFTRRLAIPPLERGRVVDGTRVFDLRAAPGSTDFGVASRPTGTWGYNGSYLGPTLRAERGERVRVNVTNGLDETTSTHWHGHHLPAAMDGGPHQPIPPGRTWSPEWVIDQPAATTWYHPHLHGTTARHVYQGLAGMFILDDPGSRAPDLPSEYGVDDVPVIVQDKSFDRGGQLDDRAPLLSMVGVLGDTVLVNGTAGAYHEVTTERVRLRILNASNARVYQFGLSDGRDFSLIGTDGGLLAAPHRRTERVQLSPGERAEVVVEMAAGERLTLRSYPPDLGTDPFTGRFAGGDDSLDVLQLRAADRLAPSPPVPSRLAPAPDLDPAGAQVTRSFRMGGTRFDGKAMEMDRIDHVVTVDTTEVWEVSNSDGPPHSFHVHDVRFQVVEVDGRPPGPELSGWKDTVYVAPGTTVRLVMRFSDYTDPDLPYMFHCHVLRHEDQGMMGQFVVVAPGQRAGTPPAHHDH